MLEYSLLVCLLCLVAVPAITNLGASADETLSQVTSGLEAVELEVDPLARWNGGPMPYAHGTGWHAVIHNQPMVIPQGASDYYVIYGIWTEGYADGLYYDHHFTQDSVTGQWTRHPPGVNPFYPDSGVGGGEGEGSTFYELFPWLPGSSFPQSGVR